MAFSGVHQQIHYIGEFSSSLYATQWVQDKHWDTNGDGTGDPWCGMLYYNTNNHNLYLCSNGRWRKLVSGGTAGYFVGYIDGIGLDWDSVSTIFLTPGVCRDDTDQDQIVVETPLPLDITTVGPNGRDTGLEEPSTWYYTWVAAGDLGTCGLFSKERYNPILPVGYDTYQRRVGVARNNSANDLLRFYTSGRGSSREYLWQTDYATRSVLTHGQETEWTIVDCSAFIPPTATVADLSCKCSNKGMDVSGNGIDVVYEVRGLANQFVCRVEIGSQDIYYRNPLPSGETDIIVAGFEEILE